MNEKCTNFLCKHVGAQVIDSFNQIFGRFNSQRIFLQIQMLLAYYPTHLKIFCFRARNVGCSLALAMRYIIVALVLKIYPWMLHSVGLSHLFMLHAVVLLIGVLFVFFVMPETRGLSLTELTTLFGGKLPNSETSSESTALTNTTSPQV